MPGDQGWPGVEAIYFLLPKTWPQGNQSCILSRARVTLMNNMQMMCEIICKLASVISERACWASLLKDRRGAQCRTDGRLPQRTRPQGLSGLCLRELLFGVLLEAGDLPEGKTALGPILAPPLDAGWPPGHRLKLSQPQFPICARR